MNFELIKMGMEIVSNPSTLAFITLGTIIGVIFGSLPGVSASMAVVLALTFTYAMSPVVAIAFLSAVYCSSITGGGITAILFKIPGTPASAVTTFDGYPMTERGEADKALGISLVTSAIGGISAAIIMIMLAPQLAEAALKFGPAELFGVTVLGLSVLTALDSGNMIQTLISAIIGLWLATVGMDPISGNVRFTWGSSTLLNGIQLIPVMIGMFAISEVMKQTHKPSEIKKLDANKKLSGKLVSLKEIIDMKMTILRSAVIGTFTGILPGAGATIASFLSYTTEVKMSKNPSVYGKGEPKGIAASETANNAATGGAMVPLLALGIPGGNAAAVMMTALTLKGVQLGPSLIKAQPQFLSSVFSALIISNIVMVIVALWIAKIFSKILNFPYSVLGPSIIILSTIGSFALSSSTGDVKLMIVAGIAGYMISKCDFNIAAIVLGLVLGGMCESNLRRAIILENGNFFAVVSKPVTATLLVICLVVLIIPVVKKVFKKGYEEAYMSSK